ncbi:SpoIIE family protein phosphatase [Quadrisphaera sp. DSM 44207]|uniref:SpoIIE family protein phosphatase n=1 Tax=Quadrisphaera sp. DSM 44207 TaxID=1881057 RepID=UPI0015A02508|nr:SpoIIE family protein phosphatase [Quadrisphaera sp. DSM 44207]
MRSAVLHQLPWYVIVYEGPEHRAAALNAEFLQVLGGFNPVGMRAADFLGGSEDQGIIGIFDRAYVGEQALFHRMRLGVATPHGHQQEIVLDFEVSPFRDRHGAIVGVVGVGRDVTATVRQQEADAAAAAELGRRYRRATDVIEEVQRALLPTRLPVLPSVEVAASYVVGGEEQAAGGDWYDVLPRPSGVVAAVVGDVVGHGVGASAVMAQLRAVALERLHAGASPADVVRALDRFVEVVPEARSATICVLHLRPGERSLEYCTAGHSPPLVIDGDGDRGSRYLDPVPAPPLGEDAERTTSTAVLSPGELVLLYTDGIIERPGTSAMAGTAELAQVAAAAAADRLMPVFTLPAAVDRVTVQTLERLTRVTGSTDDITLLALQPTAPLPDLHLAAETTRADIPRVRAEVRRWLGAERVAEHALDRLDEIVTELVDNAVEHAYADAGPSTHTGDGSGHVAVDAHLDERGVVTLTVTDRGRWRPPPQPTTGRGLGLAIVQHLTDRMQLDHTPEGTTVTVRFQPWKISHGAGPQAPRTAREVFDAFTEHRADRSILTVRGPVDASNILELDAELSLGVTPGAPPLTVDLEQVTVLSSAALHAIRRRLDQARLAGVDTHLASSPGTVAQQVFALVGIDTHSQRA